MTIKTLRILGTRGVPATHGGFETFAEHLALYLVSKGWRVIVYCQEDCSSANFDDVWQGVERVHISVTQPGPKGTILFDWRATVHASKFNDLCLTLGYNTAIFCALLRLKGVPNLINMDGIEWKRAKWGGIAKSWFWVNDWLGCWLGNHLIADHPIIKRHLGTRVNLEKISMIPYGADSLVDCPKDTLQAFGLEPGKFVTVIARAEPENSLLEIVKAFSFKSRDYNLAVLGKYDPENNSYHRAVIDAAGSEVIFLGAIYDKTIVNTLRFHSALYIHGHQVGGTNPSLVEAIGAKNAVLAHDNPFNRWVAGDSAKYFSNTEECAKCLDEILTNQDIRLHMQAGIVSQFQKSFTWSKILDEYEKLLQKWLPINVS